MSKRFDQSEERPFKSVYKDGFVTPQNYLCELIFQRRGEYDKSAMPQALWNTPKFKKWYQIELIRISRLKDDYPISTLIRAFKDTKVLSVKNPDFLKRAAEIELERSKTEKVLTKSEPVEIQKPKAAFGKKKVMDDL